MDQETDSVDWRSRVVGRSLGPAADKAVDRGRTLITAAARLIQQSGGDDFTMQELANEAGLSLGLVYQLFSGKDDLLVALVEEAQVVLAHLIERHAARWSNPLERLGAALYFATDPRQHTDAHYNAAVARYVIRVSLSAPEQLGQARRPVIDVFTKLIDEARLAGRIDDCDPHLAAASILLAYISYEHNILLGNSIGAPIPRNEQFIRFCLLGIGARLPAGWEEQFRLSDDEAAQCRFESERVAGTKSRRRRTRAVYARPGSTPGRVSRRSDERHG
jgi:AcrR family transcriptional regulator